jgi:hypothetical protein
MQTQFTFTGAGWDFVSEPANGAEDIWIMDAYPALAWRADTDDDTLLDRLEQEIIDANGSDAITGLEHVHTTTDFDGDYFSDAYEILNGWLPLDPGDGNALSAEMIAVIQANADHQGSAGLYSETAIRSVYVGTPLVEVDPHANQVTLDFELHSTDGLLAANWQPLDTLHSTDTYNGGTRFYRLFFDGHTSANGPPIVLEAEDGLVQAPFTTLHGVVWQEVQTINPLDGGLLQIDFEVTIPGSYTVRALVNAPDGSANSFFVNIDAEPVAPEMTWNISPLTSGFDERYVSRFGDPGPLGTPTRFDLDAGTHTLFIRGREMFTKIDRIVIE